MKNAEIVPVGWWFQSRAREAGLAVRRLEINCTLKEAQALYRKQGYIEGWTNRGQTGHRIIEVSPGQGIAQTQI